MQDILDDFPKLGTATPDIGTEEETATQEELEKPWNVIVHNDPINLMSYVTLVFMRVLGMPRKKAERHMTEVHKNGKSIVWSGDRERAEHYVHQLHQAMLLTTMEPSQ